MTEKILKYLGKIFVAITLTPTLIILFNNYTNDSFIRMIALGQNSDWYSYLFYKMNPCDLEKKKIKNGTLLIEENYFNDSLGSCYKELIKQTELLEIDINFGGRTTSALIVANEVKKYNVDVLIKKECYSACVDILMHAKNRYVCKDSLIGIHQQSAKIENKWIKEYLSRNQKYAMLGYKELGFNVKKIQDILDKTPSEEMYELNEKELIETGIATEIIACNNV